MLASRFVRSCRLMNVVGVRCCSRFMSTAPQEDLDKKRARLLYQSTKRGILECDILLGGFAKKYLNTLDEQELIDYDAFINGTHVEWDIYYWLSDARPPPDEVKTGVFAKLHKYAHSELTVHPNLRKP